jgi:aspartate/methionine/tyrosine aminotransferase
MNPVRALSSLAFNKPRTEPEVSASIKEAVFAWSRATGIELDPRRTVVGCGVRVLLSAALSSVLSSGQELWLPEDVYPVYRELAENLDVTLRSFPTLPQPNLDFLGETGQRAAVVLPVPISPLGRLPTDAETSDLRRWLHHSKDRLLILDAVYMFDFEASRPLIDSFLDQNGDQCIVLWSCSKCWLSPGSLGLSVAPPGVAATLRRRVVPPDRSNLGGMKLLLETRPDLSRMLQEAFSREWQRLRPFMCALDADWAPPEMGYFSVLHASFTQLLDEHGVLSVPASVFGSPHEDLSIVTCLYSLAEHTEVFRS